MARGINPYPYDFPRTDFSTEILASFKDDAPPRDVAIAGRIVSIRRMGKASFCHVADSHGKIQAYIRKDNVGDSYEAFRLLDIGDLIGVKGYVFRTKMGEVSVHAKSFELLAKSLRPLPVVKEKVDEQGNKQVFDPFADKELRYRQRYVDLAVNPAVREVFVKRARIISFIRNFFDTRGYLEVETPPFNLSTAARLRDRSSRITTRWTSTSFSASRTSCISNPSSSVGTTGCTSFPKISATRE